jgi:hypothetical protein
LVIEKNDNFFRLKMGKIAEKHRAFYLFEVLWFDKMKAYNSLSLKEPFIPYFRLTFPLKNHCVEHPSLYSFLTTKVCGV